MFSLFIVGPLPLHLTDSLWETIRDKQSAASFKFPERNLNNISNSCNARAHRMRFALLGAVSVKKERGLWSE